MSASASTALATERPVLNALEAWTLFALPPISMELPVAWYPRLSQWAANNARVRWESLTETPLEVSWTWDERKDGQSFDQVSSRLEAAWKKEQLSAEDQAKTGGIEFKWLDASYKTSESKAARHGLPEGAEGFTRRYQWEDRVGVLAALYLGNADRRALVALALCPALEPSSKSLRDSSAIIQRIFGSLKLSAKQDPSLIAWPGLHATFPAGMKLDTIKPGAGQLYLDWHSKERRISLIRMSFADQHLALALETARKVKKGKGANLSTLDDGWRLVGETLAMKLFDRSEGPGMLYQVAGSGASGAAPAQAPADAAEIAAPSAINGHACSLYAEKRPFYVRWGDTALRGMGRKWSGQGLAALWRCEETGTLWGVGVRAEPDKTRAELDALVSKIDCHAQPSQCEIDWLALVNTSLKRVVKKAKAEEKKDGKPADPPPPNPVEMRIKQFQFRLKPQANVRLEISSKDRTGRLVYELAAPTGLLAKLSGANNPGQPYLRTLDLDPLGRRVWEILETEPTIGELLGTLSREMRVHPVEFYELVLAFLRMLGERGLATAAEPTK